jgi:hypothetical protein
MLINAVPLVLSSPTLRRSAKANDAWKMVHVPIPLFSNLENSTSMGLYVLTGICLSCLLEATKCLGRSRITAVHVAPGTICSAALTAEDSSPKPARTMQERMLSVTVDCSGSRTNFDEGNFGLGYIHHYLSQPGMTLLQFSG